MTLNLPKVVRTIIAGLLTFLITETSLAHQSGCHRWHSCPSDTGSYVCGDLGYSRYCGGDPGATSKTKPEPDTIPAPAQSSPTIPATIVGRASIIDGDTLEIHNQLIRLHGIDAPEADQTCRADGIEYRCGQQAALALADKIGQQAVSCQSKDRDHYGRIIAVCWLGTEDLGVWIVSRGWALAYRRYSVDYVLHEDTAKQGRRGLWRGEFVTPEEWRRGKR